MVKTVFRFEAIIKRWPFLRTIFASSARKYNERNFPQDQLACKINSRFLLHEHGDPHFLMHEFKLRERQIPFKNTV